MVHMPGAGEAAAMARRTPSLGVGVHLTLTAGRPVLPPEEVPSLVDAEGRFFPRRVHLAGRARTQEIEREWTAQVERFLALGLTPTHLDSHHHAHAMPEALPAIIRIARRYGLPVRSPSPEVRAALREAGVATTDHYIGDFYDRPRVSDPGWLVERLAQLPEGITEVMCHPAVASPELAALSSYNDQRAEELATLLAFPPEVLAERWGIAVASWAAVRDGSR